MRLDWAMLMIKLRLKTWEQLSSEGFTLDYPRCYKGTKKAPDATFPYHYRDSILGKVANVWAVKDFEAGTLDVTIGGHSLRQVPVWMFQEMPKLMELAKPTRKRFAFGHASHVKGLGFRFSCSLDELTEEQAVQVAQWVLERAK